MIPKNRVLQDNRSSNRQQIEANTSDAKGSQHHYSSDANHITPFADQAMNKTAR